MSGVDSALLAQVVVLTRDVNANLGNFTVHTDRLIRRQNVLIVLCILVVVLLSVLIVYIYDNRRTQELIGRHMELIRYHMMDIETGRKVIGSDLIELRESLETLNLIIEDSVCSPLK